MANNIPGVNTVDRCFIVFGKACSGKSTLGNLLLGKKKNDKRRFITHEYHEPGAMTVKVQSEECQIIASKAYEQGNLTETLKIQVIDQPGSNDPNFTQERYCKFLTQAVAMSKAEMSATFLILIDLESSLFTFEELLTLLNLAEVLSNSCYSFFTNAIIVFTHADLIDDKLDKKKLQDDLIEKLKGEEFASIQKLIDFVGKRYIYINGVDDSEMNRETILKQLFQLSKPNLNVYINGNNTFKGKDLKALLFKEGLAQDFFEKKLLKYDIAYHFNPDLNLFKKLEKKNLEEGIKDALEKLSGISEGISAMVLLINLEVSYNNEINNLILNLPKTYNLGKDFKKDFWNYACILFRAPVDDRVYVEGNIKRNRLLKNLEVKVNSRYTWVTKKFSDEECCERLTDLVRKVKLDAEGKYYTDSVVLAEMKKAIHDSRKARTAYNNVKMVGEIKDQALCDVIPFYKQSDSKMSVNINGFFWGRETISPTIGYFILKNINENLADKFKDRFPGNEEIKTDEYIQYCLEVMKTF